MKTINNFIIIFLLTVISSFGQDKRPFAFITTGGKTIRQAEVRAHNLAYMNNLKVVSYNTTTVNGQWVSIAKVVNK